MSAKKPTPYGLKNLLECLSRAALLEQPDGIPEFLSTHVDEMIRFRGEEARDTKEVVFQYQEQWENAFLQKESEKTETPITAPEEPPSPTSTDSITPPVSFRVSPPPDVSSVRLPTHDSVGPTTGQISPSTQGQTKASLPSATSVLPPIQQKAPSKRAQGQKTTSGFTCRLKDCCYHDKPKVGCAVDSELAPVRHTTDLGLKRLPTAPSKPDVQVPYRPKGGFIIDRELEPMRTRVRPVTKMPCPILHGGGGGTNRTTGTESHLLRGRQDAAYSRQGAEVAHCTDLSMEYSVHSADSVHIIRYTYTHVQCSKLPPGYQLPPNISENRGTAPLMTPEESLHLHHVGPTGTNSRNPELLDEHRP